MASIDLFAIAVDYKQVPITEWDIKGTYDKIRYGAASLVRGRILLRLEGEQEYEVGSLPQALRAAEDMLAARTQH